jgi:hypothetical protein
MHEFDAGDRNRRVSKTFEPQHRTQPKLDRSMVLFNQIIEVFRRSNLSPIAASMCGKKLALLHGYGYVLAYGREEAVEGGS